MGKSVRNNDPFVLSDQPEQKGATREKVAQPKATDDPFVLVGDDTTLIKKKAGTKDSAVSGGPIQSTFPSADDINKASKAWQDKTLSVKDQNILASTDWGKQQGLTMDDKWKDTFVKAHNGPQTSELINSVMNVLNANYPRDQPGSPKEKVRNEILGSVQSGDVPAIQKVRNSIVENKQAQILKIQNDPQGSLASSGIIGQPMYVQTTTRTLSDEQRGQIKVLQDEVNLAKASLDAFTAHAIVGKKENQLQLKAELSPQNIKFSDLTLSAESIGREMERTIGISKTIPNSKYEQTRAGLEAIIASYNMDINDMLATGMKSKNPDLLNKAQNKIKELGVLQARYNNLDNQFPDVGTFKTARYLGDILAEIKPNRLLTTSKDVGEAAAIAEKRNPGFMQSHGKFVETVARSEGNWIGVKSGMIPQGGFIGGIKAGTENIGYGGAAFVASPLGRTWDPKTLEQIEAFQAEPQMKGTSSAGAQPTKIVYDKNSKAFREDKNENYGSWDFNSAMYSLGKGIPTLAEWVVLDKGLGGLAKGGATLATRGFNLIGKEVAATTNVLLGAEDVTAGYKASEVGKGFEKTAGLYATTYVTSFDENRRLADNLIEDKSSMGEAKKNVLANFLTLSTAGIFSMMDYSPTKAVEAALSKNAAPDVLKFLEKSGWQDLSEEGANNLIREKIYPRVKAIVKASGTNVAAGAKLGAASVIDQKIKDFTALIINPKKAESSSLEDNVHSFVDQVLLMTVAGLPGIVRSGAFPHTSKDALYQAGILAPQYIDRINERASNGDIDQAQANKMIAMVKTMAEEVNKVHADGTKEGLPLTVQQKRDMAVNNFRKRAAQMLSENDIDMPHETINKETDNANAAIQEDNRWSFLEKSVPFQSAREVDTGKKINSLDDIDPKKKYTFDKDGEITTATGADLFTYIIHGDYETAKDKSPQTTENKEGQVTHPSEGNKEPETTNAPSEKKVDQNLLEEGQKAIQEAIEAGKLKGPYAGMATQHPDLFLREIADQAHGLPRTGEDLPGAEMGGQDAEMALKDEYGYELVDIAKKLYPKVKKETLPTIVARHAESKANSEKRASTDETPLTVQGTRQAEKLGESLAEQGYTDVVTSDTLRSRSTADIVLEKTGGNLIEHEELGRLLKEWDQTGGETIDEFAERIGQARELLKELPEGTAVIAHGKVMGMLEALDKAGGDIEKAKENFDKTKVYGNTDTYIPSLKPKENEKGNARQGNEESRQGNPEGRQKGDGESSGSGKDGPVDRNVGETAERPYGERGQEKSHVLDESGTASDSDAVLTRESRVNDLLQMVNSLNQMPKDKPERDNLYLKIQKAVNDLGLKYEYGEGFATIKDAQGNKIQATPEQTNTSASKDFDLNAYKDRTKKVVSDIVRENIPLTGISVSGIDGQPMSELQKLKALEDLRAGNMTNGAKAIYDTVEGILQDGFVELTDPRTKQRVGVPVDEYLQAFGSEPKPLSDDELTELNTALGEDIFGKIFDDIYESTQESNETKPNTQQNSEIEQPVPGETAADTGETGRGQENTRASEQSTPQPEAQGEVAAEKVTGIRNIVVNTERMDRSLDPVIKEAATTFADTWDTAKNMVRTGTVDPRSLVNALAEDPKPKVSDVDNALILMDRIDLTNQRLALLDAIEESKQSEDEIARLHLEQRLMDVDQKIIQNDEVADRTGQETAKALSSRRMLATLDFSLSKMTAEIRRLYPSGEVPSAMMQKLKEIEKDHADLLRKYAEREEQWKREQAERAFAEEKARVSKESAKPGTTKKIALKGKDLADKIRSLRPKGGETLQSHLFSLPIAIYDTALVTIANLVEGGAKLVDAIDTAIENIRFASEKDKTDFIDHLNGASFEEEKKDTSPAGIRNNLLMELVQKVHERESSHLGKDSVTPLRKIASSYIKEGINTLDELVDKVHEDVVAHLPDVTKREIRDAFSGYGNAQLETRNELGRQIKELQRQAVIVSQMEDVFRGTTPERKSRTAGTPSKEVVRLRTELQKAMKDSGMTWEEPPRSKEEQAARALQSTKNRLKNEIELLNHRIRTGESAPERIPTQWDEERRRLTEQRDSLKKIFDETNSSSKLSDEMRIKRIENALKKQIAQYTEIIEKGGGPLAQNRNEVSTPAIEALKVQRNSLRELNRKMQVDNSPKSTPEQIALEAYKDRIKNRVDNLTQKIAEGDFETKERQSIQKDAEALRLDLALKKKESEYYSLKGKAEKENRGRLQKIFDGISAYKRMAVLSGLPSAGKILLAVTYRTIGTPAEELVGAGLRVLPGVRQVAEQAPREGRGFTISGERSALSEWVNARTYKDWLYVLKKGRGELDYRMGKYIEENPGMLEVFGRVHASLKNFSKRAEFARSYEKRIDFARRKGFDTSQEVVQMTAAMDAYVDASRSIFMQDNILTKEYFKLLKRLEADESGMVPRVAAFLARFTMPVVKVPTNFIAETGSYAFGTLTGTAQIIYKAIQGNLTQLSAQDADLIMRSLKKGSVGLTLGVIGYLMPQLAGGYWQRGDDRDAEEVQPGELMFFGQRIPKWATHFPALEVMQMGATLRRVYDKNLLEKGQDPTKATSGAIFAAAGGLLGEVPLFEQPTQLMERVKRGEWEKLLGDQFKSLNPQLIQNIASWSDRENGEAVKRAPENPWETFKTGIPGLRQDVPRK